MAGKEPINDTTLEVLQTVDLWNSALLQVLFETVIKSNVVDAEVLIKRISDLAAKLQDRSRLPSASGYIERRAQALSEDILIWEQQSREDD
jgi:hypothetical protein